LKPAAIRRFSLFCVCMPAQPTVKARSAKAPIRLNPVIYASWLFPFFWLVVWSG
jgi:hypothetical protein